MLLSPVEELAIYVWRARKASYENHSLEDTLNVEYIINQFTHAGPALFVCSKQTLLDTFQ
jgi:hypothetical protein